MATTAGTSPSRSNPIKQHIYREGTHGPSNPIFDIYFRVIAKPFGPGDDPRHVRGGFRDD